MAWPSPRRWGVRPSVSHGHTSMIVPRPAAGCLRPFCCLATGTAATGHGSCMRYRLRAGGNLLGDVSVFFSVSAGRGWLLFGMSPTQERVESIFPALVSKNRSVDGHPTSLCDLGYCSVGLVRPVLRPHPPAYLYALPLMWPVPTVYVRTMAGPCATCQQATKAILTTTMTISHPPSTWGGFHRWPT
jgi:hypothetical protein